MPAANNNHNNNLTKFLSDAIIKHKAESAMFSNTLPEVPMDEQRFPLFSYAPQQQQQQQQPLPLLQQPVQQPGKRANAVPPGRFPLLQKNYELSKFPMQQAEEANKNSPENARPKMKTPRFPQRMNHLAAGQRFPVMCQLTKRNFNYSIQSISESGPPVAAASRSYEKFPTIKKQFVSHTDNRQICKSLANANAGHGNCQNNAAITDVVPTPATPATTTTVTQASHNMSTKIDMDSRRSVNDNNDDGVAVAVDDGDDDDDVHKARFDNELIAHEQTLNLNVAAEGVHERKEIEHQQAENFNDAFGRRHDNDKGDGHGDGDDDDAMNFGFAKNKREICEQSKLETTAAAAAAAAAAKAHNELNMTKEQQPLPQQQSICLASEQNQNQTIEEPAASNRQQRHSDARESSSEQVDGQQRQRQQQQFNSTTANVIQTESEATRTTLISSSSSSPSLPSSSSSRYPSIEFLKCAVRGLLEEGASSVPVADLDLFDLLSDLVQLIATPTNTGNFWSEPLVEQVASECPDMTVSKVSDDSEATAIVVDIYSEQIEQPQELDDNNNNSNSNNTSNSSSSSNSNDMKYELLKSTSRLPETLSSRLSSPAIVPAAAAAATVVPVTAATTSRIRDVTLPTVASSSRPLLGELKRSSTSRDDSISIDVDSLLPERTRLRRQRRMRSQESVEEKPEDVIERLNKLKARISGALSEVKGVLKQYSTESEAEAAGEKWLGPSSAATAASASASTSASTPASAPLAEAASTAEPVQFRFLKKVRRRSYFDEAEEEREQAKELENVEKPKESETKSTEAPRAEVKSESAAEPKTKVIEEQPKPTETVQVTKLEAEKEKLTEIKVKEEQEKLKVEQPKDQQILIEATTAKADNVQMVKQEKEAKEKLLVNGELPPKVQAKIEFLAKVQSELKSKPKTKEPAAVKEQPKETVAATTAVSRPQQPIEAVEATPQTATLPNESATQPDNLDVSSATATPIDSKPAVVKKKTIIKVRNPRRASIAAVEPSKIVAEPVQIDALAQRRPSDSEAIVKRKKKQKLTTTATISGSNQSEAAPAAKLQEATATNEQLVAAKVNNNAITAKSVTKPTAKSVEGDEKTKAEAAASIATTAATTATTAATAATTATLQAAPKQLPIDGIANQATASKESRRASLKLAELVGETVLVVPASAAAATAATGATAITINSENATDAAALSSAVNSSLSQSKEPINQAVIIPVTAETVEAEATPQQVVVAVDIEVAPVDIAVASAPQIAATLSEVSHDDESSPQQQQLQHEQEQQLVEATKDNAQEQPNDSLVAMPELKVLTGPVQPVKIETVEQPHDESDLVAVKKKSTHLKKLVRKNSIDKGKEKLNESVKLSNILKDKNKISDFADRINKQTPPKKQTKAAAKEQAEKQPPQQENAELPVEQEFKPELEPEPAQPEAAPTPAPKKPRQIKKKVIIKRQKRRLSIGDTFFIQQEPEEPKVPEIETIEKAIAYVTDDEADVEPESEIEPAKPLKSCLHVREYKIGDLVLYAERYRKTQVRWKRGRVLERITSISYKLEIEGKEVPAHISYIKKYTGRKVKFVGKEYLEIDYEQVVEEERRARSYSIWNMV